MTIRRLVIAATLVLTTGLAAQTIEVQVSGAQQWTDSGLDVQPGDTLKISATGTLRYADAKENGPNGLSRGWKDLLRILPVNEAGRGALIGRIGSSEAARPFLIGPVRESKMVVGGRLFLGINQGGSERATGQYAVTLVKTAAPVQASSTAPVNVLKFSQEIVDSLPKRVVDAAGTEGDRVNFMIVGSEDQVKSALINAGWVTVDKDVKSSVLRGALASLSKQAYTTLPMSELMLFGRTQDYGWAQGDPIKVVAARHHFRIWKAPFDHGGETVWVGAGTHDVGFDKDQRNGNITHKIDPDTDKERDYIGQSLSTTGLVVKLDYVTAANAVKEAKTAHGQAFFSDGRTLVIYLRPDERNLAPLFADVFCSVLKQKNPDTGEWGGCGDYLQSPGKEDVKLDAITDKYRVLVVPGILSSCASDAPAFLEGREHLKKAYNISTELFAVPNDSSDENAAKIAEYVRGQMEKDQRKFIVIGYSKGTPDLQVALAKEKGMREAVAAFVSVAGASGGSPIADTLPQQAERWVQMFKMGNCQGDLSKGMKSLSQAVRRAFLSSFPDPMVPTYSLVAVSDQTNTSSALLKAWQLMNVFDKFHDGQLTKADAIVPGAKYLGAARADHLAVALPFDKSSDEMIRKAMDKGRYPRAALLESVVRVVVQELEAKKP